MTLWPEPCPASGPHPARKLELIQAARFIIEHWDRNAMMSDTKMARLAICKVAFMVTYPTVEERAKAMAWACHEMPYWSIAFQKGCVSEQQLREFFHEYLEPGGIS